MDEVGVFGEVVGVRQDSQFDIEETFDEVHSNIKHTLMKGHSISRLVALSAKI